MADGPARGHRAAEGPGPEGGRRAVVARRGRTQRSRASNAQGRVHEIADRDDRLAAIAREYLKQPDGTLVVSPDNQSRTEINQMIHRAMQRGGHVDRAEHGVRVLVARQEITGADRQWAERYDRGDVVRYSKGSKTLGLDAGRVRARGTRERHGQSRHGPPRRRRARHLRPAAAARRHALSRDRRARSRRATACSSRRRTGSGTSRIASSAPSSRSTGVASCRSASIRAGRWRSTLKDHPHLDYGYAVTSHSSQGQTADRVLVHVDTDRAGEQLVNRRLAYVAVSRGRHDAQIYTNDKAHLAQALSRDVAHRSAMEPSLDPAAPSESLKPSAQDQAVQQTITQGLSH